MSLYMYMNLCTWYMCVCIHACMLQSTYIAISTLIYCKQTPLHLAAKGGFWQCMELLLEHKAKLNVEDMQRRTPRDHIRGRPKCNLVVTQHIGKYVTLRWVFHGHLLYVAKFTIPQRNQSEKDKVQCKLTSPTHYSHMI